MRIYLLFMLIFFSATVLHASDSKICFFALLPADARNRIASYLDACETDQEFIARTRKYGGVSKEHKKLADKQDIKCMIGEQYGIMKQEWSWLHYAYSGDCSKVIRLACTADLCSVTTTDIETGIVTHENKLSKCNLYGCDVCIAVSHGGTRVASLQRAAYTTGAKNNFALDYALIVAQVDTRARKIFRIPSYYDNFVSIGFNKQTTKIIVHARNDTQWDNLSNQEKPETFYYMEPLTKPEVHTLRSTVSLDAYFYCRAICKPITSELSNGKLI